MRAMLRKETRLAALPLAYLFTAFGLMSLIPGYPVLCGYFFVTLGIFQSFLSAREAGDVLYTALLPVPKRDAVKGKYLFAVLIEGCGFLISAAATALRMTVFSGSSVYRENALMNANLFCLGAGLFIFGLFNAIVVGGFFKTAFRLGVPFVIYSCSAFVAIGIAESLHHFPGLDCLNAFGTDRILLQSSLLFAGALLYAALTFFSYRKACADFEKVDL